MAVVIGLVVVGAVALGAIVAFRRWREQRAAHDLEAGRTGVAAIAERIGAIRTDEPDVATFRPYGACVGVYEGFEVRIYGWGEPPSAADVGPLAAARQRPDAFLAVEVVEPGPGAWRDIAVRLRARPDRFRDRAGIESGDPDLFRACYWGSDAEDVPQAARAMLLGMATLPQILSADRSPEAAEPSSDSVDAISIDRGWLTVVADHEYFDPRDPDVEAVAGFVGDLVALARGLAPDIDVPLWPREQTPS